MTTRSSKKRTNASGTVTLPQPTEVDAISLDLGNAYSNLMASGGLSCDWRSIQGRLSDSTRLKELPFDHCINIGGVHWVFGAVAYTWCPRTLEDFPATNRYFSDWYRRLFLYALHRAFGLRLGEGVFYPQVVLSIPAGLYANEDVVRKVRETLTGSYRIGTTLGTDLNIVISPDALKIIPEGAGAYIACASAPNGAVFQQGLWFVVDVGYLTSDIVAFRDGDYVPDLSNSDPAAGMRYVSGAVARKLHAITSVDLKPEEIDPYLQCDAMTVNSVSHPIGAYRTAALTNLGTRISGFVQRNSAGLNLTGIILAGGGADYVKEYVGGAGLPAIHIAPNARRANVEGAFSLIAR